MFVAWVLFPLVALLVFLGCGLLVERIAGVRFSAGVLVSLGLALVIVAATLTTDRSGTASLTTPLVVALALAGYATSLQRVRRLRVRAWALAAALGVYCVAAAPVVATGSAAFLGYFQLNDTAVHLMLIDHLLGHGRSLSGLVPSAYTYILHNYISTSYPVGAQVALGAVRPLIGQDAAWIFQPFLAMILALGAAVLYELLDAVRSKPLRAACAFVAAQPAIYYAYYLEASIKEIATAWVVTLTVVLVVALLRERLSIRRVVPVVVAAVAGLDVLDLAILPWVGIPLGVCVLIALWRLRHAARRASRGRIAVVAAGGAAATAVLAAPIIARASSFFNAANSVLTTPGDLGNLVTPLSNWQVFGIWPSDDFRFGSAAHLHVGYVLIGIAAMSSVLGTAWCWRRRAWGPLLLILGNSIAVIVLLNRASPYASAKVIAIFSVTVVMAAMLGAVALHESRRRIEAWALAAVIAFGVLWTNLLQYHGSSVAPRDRLAELDSIGARFSGQGPSFYNQSDEFAAYFLRREAASDPAFGLPPARPGLAPRTPGQSRNPWDPDEFALPTVESFDLLVMGRSPRISRPPANFRLVYEGRFYAVWKREAAPTVLAHVPLGEGLQPSAVPSCSLVAKTAAQATREHARLAYVAREPAPALDPVTALRPPNWGEIAGEPFALIPREQRGSISGPIEVPRAGRYELWLQGSIGQRIEVSLDGRHVGSVSYEIGPPGQFDEIGETVLPAGSTQAVITWPPSKLAPGQENINHSVGPLMLVPSGTHPEVETLAPASARSLCGRSLDWIEVIR